MGLLRRLVVMESEWWPGYSHTVRPALEFLSHDIADRDDNFRYERFVGRESFFETLAFAVRQRDARFFYIACHGSEDALECPNGSQVSAVELGAALKRVNRGTQIDGVFLSSCLVGRVETAQSLLNSNVAGPQRLKWVAGYSTSVDWFDAMLLDLLFLRTLIRSGDEIPPRRRVEHAIDNLVGFMPGIVRSTGFAVFVRQQKTGDVIDIVPERLAAAG